MHYLIYTSSLDFLADIALQHNQCSDNAQGSSDTNQPEASTKNTLNNASTTAKEENILPLNSPVSNRCF
jgi:hypothetical protein